MEIQWHCHQPQLHFVFSCNWQFACQHERGEHYMLYTLHYACNKIRHVRAANKLRQIAEDRKRVLALRSNVALCFNL